MITIQGADRVARNLMNYAVKIKNQIAIDVETIGKEVEEEIKQEFPELAIQSNFNPSFPEYIISTGGEVGGEGLTLCRISGKVIMTSRERMATFAKTKGKNAYVNVEELGPWEDELVAKYLNEARERIESSLQMILN
jgi:hypothetical protein